MRIVNKDIEDEFEEIQVKTKKKEAKIEEDGVPVFWKIFGGSVFSIIIFLILAICGYIINHINNIQHQVSNMASQTVQKTEFDDRAKTIEDMREKISIVSQQQKDLSEKLTRLETLATEEFRAAQEASKEFHASKERLSAVEKRFDEIREIREKIEVMREKIASLQTKTETPAAPPAVQPQPPTQPIVEPKKD